MITSRSTLALLVALASCSDSKPATIVDTRPPDARPADTKAAPAEMRVDGKAPADLRSDRPVDVRLPDKAVLDLKKDSTSVLNPTVNEKWYQGGTTCGAPQMLITKPYPMTLQVQLLQIPFNQVQGTCSGHKAVVTVGGGTIQIEITGNTGSACFTSCWDFTFPFVVPPGTYTVKYLNLTETVTVSHYNG